MLGDNVVELAAVRQENTELKTQAMQSEEAAAGLQQQCAALTQDLQNARMQQGPPAEALQQENMELKDRVKQSVDSAIGLQQQCASLQRDLHDVRQQHDRCAGCRRAESRFAWGSRMWTTPARGVSHSSPGGGLPETGLVQEWTTLPQGGGLSSGENGVEREGRGGLRHNLQNCWLLGSLLMQDRFEARQPLE